MQKESDKDLDALCRGNKDGDETKEKVLVAFRKKAAKRHAVGETIIGGRGHERGFRHGRRAASDRGGRTH